MSYPGNCLNARCISTFPQTVEGHPDPRVPEMVNGYRSVAQEIGVLAVKVGRQVGVSDEGVRARMALTIDRLSKMERNSQAGNRDRKSARGDAGEGGIVIGNAERNRVRFSQLSAQ